LIRIPIGLPTNQDALKAAEDQLARPLPRPLRERLLRNNGGDIGVKWLGQEDEWQLHPVWDDSDRETMRRSSNHLVREQESAREWPGFPAGAVSIATSDGDQLVLLRDQDEPKLWLHDTGDLETVEIVWDP
jgi:hypothetical protein